MKHEISSLRNEDFVILAMAIRALGALRLNPRLALVDESYPEAAAKYMNELLNGFKDMCRDLDLLINDADSSISRLLSLIDDAAEEDVYQSFCEELKHLNQHQPKE